MSTAVAKRYLKPPGTLLPPNISIPEPDQVALLQQHLFNCLATSQESLPDIPFSAPGAEVPTAAVELLCEYITDYMKLPKSFPLYDPISWNTKLEASLAQLGFSLSFTWPTSPRAGVIVAPQPEFFTSAVASLRSPALDGISWTINLKYLVAIPEYFFNI